MLFEGIKEALREGRPRQVDKLMREALNGGVSTTEMLDRCLLPAMEYMEGPEGEEELNVARTLACAKALKQALNVMEVYIAGNIKEKHGKIIIGTAGGDLHDVGKSLVRVMLQSEGFEIVDLGVDVSPQQFVKALAQHPDTDIVTVSAMVSTALPSLRHIVQTLNGLDTRQNFSILVGGGPVTREFAESIQADRYTDDAKAAAKAALELVKRKKA